MTNTATYPVTIDGVRLDTLAWNISTRSGRMSTPAIRGDNPIVAGRSGRPWRKGKRFDQNTIVLDMWIDGCDADGGIPAGSSALAEFRKNLDALNALFGRRERLLDYREGWPGGDRQALVEVGIALDPTVIAMRPTATYKVELINPAAFLRDTADVTHSQAGAVSGTVYDLTEFAGSTAPMEDLTYVVHGPGNNLRIVDDATGHYVQLNGALAAGDDWRVYAGDDKWESVSGTGIGYAGAGNSRVADTVRSGFYAPRYMVVTPQGLTAPKLRLEGTGFTAATGFDVRGRRKYL